MSEKAEVVLKNKMVRKIVEVLNCIAKHDNGATCSEIVKETKLPKSTVFDILQALYDTECVYYKDEKIKSYAIGSTIYILGSTYSLNSTLVNLSNEYIKDVAEKINQPVLLSKFAMDRAVYINRYDAEKSIIKAPDVGKYDDDLKSAVGKVFLAFIEEDLCGRLDIDVPKEELRMIQKNRYLMTYDEEYEHTYTIAVPIFNFESKICGVISTIGIHILGQNHYEVLEMIMTMAKAMSKSLRYKEV
ncbi:IclR family transcriptional regulator [Chakrabartyella piscis]|uniref:IclR family transcriptional regulator n=1 Tax=Chakrabartyella piscis TaxID=2918914 RepID=UPI002958C30A|nr:helix-turn-helix domain-containing protein [Chakrabartyella piscis]